MADEELSRDDKRRLRRAAKTSNKVSHVHCLVNSIILHCIYIGNSILLHCSYVLTIALYIIYIALYMSKCLRIANIYLEKYINVVDNNIVIDVL